MEYFRGKGAVIENIMAAMPDPPAMDLVGETWTIDVDEIPCDYVALENEIRLVAIGKIHDAGEGCACPMGCSPVSSSTTL